MGTSDKEGISQIEALKEEAGNGRVKMKVNIGAQELKEIEEEEYCKTPTGSGSRIPQIENCPPPPPPRKRRCPFAASSSSSLFVGRSFTDDELHFFEDSRFEDLNSFFQSISVSDFSKVKKRCKSI